MLEIFYLMWVYTLEFSSWKKEKVHGHKKSEVSFSFFEKKNNCYLISGTVERNIGNDVINLFYCIKLCR